MNTQTNETKQAGQLSFDGCGINGPDKYKTRIATFAYTKAVTAYGPLFAAAPELLDALEMLIEQVREHNQRQTNLGNCIIWDRKADDILARAKGGV